MPDTEKLNSDEGRLAATALVLRAPIPLPGLLPNYTRRCLQDR